MAPVTYWATVSTNEVERTVSTKHIHEKCVLEKPASPGRKSRHRTEEKSKEMPMDGNDQLRVS